MNIKIEACQRLLATSVRWVIPALADLDLEYKYEYKLPSRNWKARCKTIGCEYPLFNSLDDFIAKVKSASVVALPKNVHNMTDFDSIEAIKDLVASYQFPRDVDRLVEGFKAGVKMPMPIIIQGSKGRWILSGNTRQNIARVMNIPVKVILIKA